jgi:hypothetical protein
MTEYIDIVYVVCSQPVSLLTVRIFRSYSPSYSKLGCRFDPGNATRSKVVETVGIAGSWLFADCHVCLLVRSDDLEIFFIPSLQQARTKMRCPRCG